MATEFWVNIGSGNGLLPDGTNPSPEPMLTYHQWGPVVITWGQFHIKWLSHQLFKLARKLISSNFIQISQGSMGKRTIIKFTDKIFWVIVALRELTHWGRDQMDAISQTTFWIVFSWMKMFEFRLKFHWSLFLRVQLTIFQHWSR